MRKIELLAKSHNRDGFDCGSEPLNLFLKQTARQHADRGISRTLVLMAEEAPIPKPIIGFFFAQSLPGKIRIPDGGGSPETAARCGRVRLGRLARSREYKGQGIGDILLVAAMRKFLEILHTAGGFGLFVDAKDQNAGGFYERNGFVSLPSNELELFLPVKTIQAVLASD